jgi:chemotaxis family two-component system response regulator Rcp1
MERGEILLIDDNKSELRLLKEAFSATGFPRPVVTFMDAASAYDYITKNTKNIFVILCDISMPKMTGPELLEKINLDHELKMAAIPFIFLSNSVAEKDIEKCYSLASQGYFQKPYEMEDMTHMFKLIINYWTAAFIPYHKYTHTIL